ncbi:MAG: hypothetical protein Kow00122_18570 [Thermoleophilia bacterium]
MLLGALTVVLLYRFGPLGPVGVAALVAYVAVASRDVRWGLVGLLLTLPLGESGGSQLGVFVLSPLKVTLAAFLGAALVRTLPRSREASPGSRRWTLRPLEGAAALFGLSLILSAAAAADVTAAFKETSMTLLLVAMYGVVARSLRGEPAVRVVLWGLVVAAALISMLAVRSFILQESSWRVSLDGSGAEMRAGGVLGHPNQLAGFLTLVVPVGIALALQVRGWRRLAAAGLTVLSGVALLVTMSRTGWLAGAAGVAVLTLLVPRRSLVIGLVVLGIAAVYLVPGGLSVLITERAAGVGDFSQAEVLSRMDYWRASLRIVEESPVVGVGLGNFPQAYEALNTQGKWYIPGPIRVSPPHAHNLFLTMLAETGGVGVAAGLALLVAVVSEARRALRPRGTPAYVLGAGIVAALVAFALDNTADVTFFQNTSHAAFWVELACLTVLARGSA